MKLYSRLWFTYENQIESVLFYPFKCHKFKKKLICKNFKKKHNICGTICFLPMDMVDTAEIRIVSSRFQMYIVIIFNLYLNII